MTAVLQPGEQSQPLRALQHANEIRFARAGLKRQLKADPPLCAPLRVAYLLCMGERPDWLESMLIFDLLDAIPRFGRARARRFLVACEVSEKATVGSATVRQRQSIANALNDAVVDRMRRSERMAFERQLRAERAE